MKTILVVEDEFDLSGTLRAILEGEGYRVMTCPNGKEALERMQTARPDLVLMDVMMPMLSGLDVLRTIRRMAGLEAIPVVLMSSAFPGGKPEESSWQAFLRKPFSLSALVGTIERLIGKGAPSHSEP